MEILKIVVPRGQKPKMCSKCDYVSCNLRFELHQKVFIKTVHPNCPIAEEEEVHTLNCANIEGCRATECYPERCVHYKPSKPCKQRTASNCTGVPGCNDWEMDQCNPETCEKWQSLAKQKSNLIKENEQLRQALIDAGLQKPAIKIDLSRHA